MALHSVQPCRGTGRPQAWGRPAETALRLMPGAASPADAPAGLVMSDADRAAEDALRLYELRLSLSLEELAERTAAALRGHDHYRAIVYLSHLAQMVAAARETELAAIRDMEAPPAGTFPVPRLVTT